jgi:hypothetical protein
MPRLDVTNAFGCPIPPARQIRRPPTKIMGIRGQDRDQPLIEHAFGPILRIASKSTRERTGGHLHPDARLCQSRHHGVLVPDPRQAFRMGEDGHITRHSDAEKQVFKARRRHMMGRFNQNVPAVIQAQQVPGSEAPDKIRRNVIVGPGDEPQANPGRVQVVLQLGDSLPDVRARVLIDPRQDVGCAGDHRDTIRNEGLGHLHSGCEVRRPVIKAGQQVAVQINHGATPGERGKIKVRDDKTTLRMDGGPTAAQNPDTLDINRWESI